MCLLKYSFQILGIVSSDALVTTVLSAFLLFGLFICPVNSGLHSSIRHMSDCLGVVSVTSLAWHCLGTGVLMTS